MITRTLFYTDMALKQLERNDLMAMQKSLEEADLFLGTDNRNQNWLFSKLFLFMYSQKTALWELADKIEAEIQGYLQETAALSDKFLIRKRKEFFDLRLDSLYVLYHPEIFSLEQRQNAFVRLKPRAIQYAVAYHSEKARAYLALARAERSMNDSNWRTSLQIAEDEIFRDLKNRESLYTLQLIATQWRKGGEITKAHQLGQKAINFWKALPNPATKINNRQAPPKKLTLDSSRLAVSELLLAAGLPDEALKLLMAKMDLEDWNWKGALAEIARQYPASPPRQIMQLPVPLRRTALTAWAEGLKVEEPETQEKGGLSDFTNNLF